MAARYRRIPLSEQEFGQEQTDKKLQAERVEKISAKLHAIVWVAVAATLIRFTDFFGLMFSDDVNR